MMFRLIACVCLLAAAVNGQQAGSVTTETHPKLSWKKCSGSGSCQTVNGEIVLDANWRWLRHVGDGYDNCFTGTEFDTSYCPDDVSCAQNCALEGADYSGTYGITSTGDSLTLKLVTGSNVGSRTYLMEDENNYQIFNLLNKEFTFDVDVSKLPCGTNGALYFSEMPKNGGMGQGQNKAGAKYGTGYCDAQCPRDLKFISGEANVEGWDSSASVGKYGTCCNEMDIWEANSYGAAYTPHACSANKRCEGSECDSTCDKAGCDYSHFRLGAHDYFGKGKTVDASKKLTVVTQFVGNPLTEIRRFYIQDGRKIENSKVNISGVPEYDSITEQFCDDYKKPFKDTNTFAEKGGFQTMSKAMDNGMVLILSLWVDYAAHMLWLDSDYPTDADPSQPGVHRGFRILGKKLFISLVNGMRQILQQFQNLEDTS